MKVKIQVVTVTDDGQETTRDIACVERQDLTPETFGLSLTEAYVRHSCKKFQRYAC